MLNGSPYPIPGAPEPLRVLVIRPNELLVGVTVGLAKLLKLKTLKISTRNSDITFSVIGVCLKIDTSTVRKFGPLNASRRSFPYTPVTELVQLAGLVAEPGPPGQVNDGVLTRFWRY